VEVEEKTIPFSTPKPDSLKKLIDRDMMWGKVPFKL
jgi:hypothetical protein